MESSNPGCKMNWYTEVLGQINDVTNYHRNLARDSPFRIIQLKLGDNMKE